MQQDADGAQRIEVAQEKAAVLREALPWITRFHGQTVVIKYGGNAMVDDELKRSFAADVALLHFVGLRPVVVHGGGPQISHLAGELGVESSFVGGLRVTDEAMMDVVRMALLGQVNPEVVGLVQAAGAPAVGVAGTDAGLLRVQPALGPDGEDLGLVGEVEQVQAGYLHDLLADGFLPVVATVGRDADGHRAQRQRRPRRRGDRGGAGRHQARLPHRRAGAVHRLRRPRPRGADQRGHGGLAGDDAGRGAPAHRHAPQDPLHRRRDPRRRARRPTSSTAGCCTRC
jgi:hypothetical protein